MVLHYMHTMHYGQITLSISIPLNFKNIFYSYTPNLFIPGMQCAISRYLQRVVVRSRQLTLSSLYRLFIFEFLSFSDS